MGRYDARVWSDVRCFLVGKCMGVFQERAVMIGRMRRAMMSCSSGCRRRPGFVVHTVDGGAV